MILTSSHATGDWIPGATSYNGPSAQGYKFGSAVAVAGDGTNLFVGAMDSDSNEESQIGGVYVYTRDGVGSDWEHGGLIIRPELSCVTGCDDDDDELYKAHFGSALSIQGDLMAVGAFDYQGMGAVFIYQGSVPIGRDSSSPVAQFCRGE